MDAQTAAVALPFFLLIVPVILGVIDFATIGRASSHPTRATV